VQALRLTVKEVQARNLDRLALGGHGVIIVGHLHIHHSVVV
jgi:hypothetical protein